MNFRLRIADRVLLAGSRPYDPDVQGNITGWNLYDREWEFTKSPNGTWPTWRLKPKEENLVGQVRAVKEEDGTYYAYVGDKRYNISEEVSFGSTGDHEIHKIKKAPVIPEEELTVSPAPQEGKAIGANMNFRKKILAASGAKYENVFFAQGEDADEYMDIINSKGASALVGYLNDSGALQGNGDISDKPNHGSNDRTRRVGEFIVSWNSGIPYVGVEREILKPNPNAWQSPEEAEAEAKNLEHKNKLGLSNLTVRQRIAEYGVRENGKMHDEARQWHELKDNDNAIHSLFNKSQNVDDKNNIIHKFEHKDGLGIIDNSQGNKWMARHTKGQPTYHDSLFDAMKQVHYGNPTNANANFRQRIANRVKFLNR